LFYEFPFPSDLCSYGKNKTVFKDFMLYAFSGVLASIIPCVLFVGRLAYVWKKNDLNCVKIIARRSCV